MKVTDIRAVPLLPINQTARSPAGIPVSTQEKFHADLLAGRRDFSGMDLRGLRIARGDLTGCNFSGAQMRGSAIALSNLDTTVFTGADLRGAQFSMSRGTGILMDGAKMTNGRMTLCTFVSSVFSDTQMRYLHTTSNTFLGCNFDRAQLHGVRCDEDVFEDTSLNGARAEKTEEPAEMHKCTFRNVSMTSARLNLLISESTLQRVDFSQSSLAGMHFHGCTFEGPIEFELSGDFPHFVDTTFDNVNFLPLAHMPAAWLNEPGFEKERLHYEKNRPVWQSIIEWKHRDDGQPILSVNLDQYKDKVQSLDALTRRHLREKVSTLMRDMAALSSDPRAQAIFNEIMAMDDAMTARENKSGFAEARSGMGPGAFPLFG